MTPIEPAAPGLLMALSDAPAGRADAFERWYREHATARLDVPGIRSATRYRCIDGTPQHMACYDLDTLQVLESDAYTRLRRHRPPGESEMLASLPTPIDRRMYRLLDATCADQGPAVEGSHLVAVWLTVPDEAELHRWYTEEHVPMLLAVGGWLRVRRFVLVQGAGPKFLALHDLASLDALRDPRYHAAGATAWRTRVLATRTAYERRTYRLHVHYGT